MLDYIAKKLGYVREDSLKNTIAYYTGRIRSQKAVIDTQQNLLYNNRLKIADLEETCQILRRDYDV